MSAIFLVALAIVWLSAAMATFPASETKRPSTRYWRRRKRARFQPWVVTRKGQGRWNS